MNGLNAWKIKESNFEKQKNAQDKIRFLLQYAILSPSTHNTQPWLFRISENSCSIFINPSLRLPQADVKGRDLMITMGCCVENLIIAANYFGVFERLQVFPKGEKNLIAQIFFKDLETRTKKLATWQEIFRAIPKRITVRGLFDKKTIPSSLLSKVSKLEEKGVNLFIISDKEKIDQMARLTAQGLKMAYKRPEFRKEMSGWINPNLSLRKEGIPGYSLRLPNLISLIFPTLVRLKDLGQKVGYLNYISMRSTACVCVITAKKDSKNTWFNTGRIAERAMLSFYANGAKTSIFVASVEIGNLYKDVQKIIGTKDIPQFVFCAGYMNREQKPTPRHSVKSKIIE